MKIPFDINYRPQIERGEFKVVTADDHPVRICCWDAEEDWPIVALVKDYNDKSDYCYPMMCDSAGVSATKGKDKQLFIVTPDPELTEFEEAYLRIVHLLTPKDILPSFIEKHNLREHCNELLEVAKKQFDSDLPKWKKVEADVQYPPCITRYMDENGDWQYCFSSGRIDDCCQYILVAELVKLQMEE